MCMSPYISDNAFASRRVLTISEWDGPQNASFYNKIGTVTQSFRRFSAWRFRYYLTLPYLRHTILQASHPTNTVVGCSAPSVRAATSLTGCPPAGRCQHWAEPIVIPICVLQCVWHCEPDSLRTYFLWLTWNTYFCTWPEIKDGNSKISEH